MAGKGKALSGQGWVFEPAGQRKVEETVSLPKEQQKVKISLEKRAKGKTVTLLTGFVLSPSDRKALAKEFKNSCGSGGADKEGHIEIQGDHQAAIREILQRLGWKA